MVILYDAGSKVVSIKELFGRYGDEDFGNDENTSFECEDSGDNERFIEAINALEFNFDFQEKDDANDNFISNDNSIAVENEGYIIQTPAIAAEVFIQIIIISLASYRYNGPLGKLHSIGVLFRNNSQFNNAFRDA
jgi:hypothetical protein